MHARVLAAALLLPALGVQAYQLDRLTVQRAGEEFQLVLDARIEAPPEPVFARLADLAALPALNPSITAVRLGAVGADRRQALLTEAQFCVLAVCQMLRHSQQVLIETAAAGGSIHSLTDAPPASDFASGEARWQVMADGKGSRLCFEARLTPAFWLPPLLGAWAVERRLREEALTTVERLEQLTRQPAP